jgi:signal transduction histidine kinase
VRIPGGIRVRIALALVGIVAAALGAAYLIVIPSLEQRLVEARLDELEKRAAPLVSTLPEDRFLWGDSVDAFAVGTNARVVAYDVLTQEPLVLRIAADSLGSRSRDVENNETARRALTSGEAERDRVIDGGTEYGDLAVPVDSEAVVLFRASLADSLATVRLVERRLLVATAFALVFALVLGLFASGLLASRLRRLETAAERIAGGDFGHPVVDRGDDEIGQLAQAFDRMRVQLAQLDSARKEFVANASHELRTPLFSIGGFLELLADEELDEETRATFLATMQSQVERLTRLSTDLLDLSRVDAGQLRVAREPVDLGAVARGLAEDLAPLSTTTGHTLESTAHGQQWATADDERVRQIGRALVANALVHTPEGTHVSVGARRSTDRAELVVEDDGPGIPDAAQEAVFERFYRAEGGVASGSGLGLAIAKELAALMDGVVRLESRPGRTVFTLELPTGDPYAWPAEPAIAFSRENAPP